jgi:hypothetical protein
MNYAKNQRNNSDVCLLLVILAALVIVSLTSCTTVTPHTVNSSAYSWDGTNQNSGVIGFVGSQVEVTPHWRDRYNGLVAIYGKKFVPPLTFDYGITPTATNTYLVTPEAFKDFVDMNRWRKVDAVAH